MTRYASEIQWDPTQGYLVHSHVAAVTENEVVHILREARMADAADHVLDFLLL